MAIDNKVCLFEILYEFLTIYQYDTISKALINYSLKSLRAPVLSYNSTVS